MLQSMGLRRVRHSLATDCVPPGGGRISHLPRKRCLGPWQREQREWSRFGGSRRAAFSDLKACPKEKEWLVCPPSYVLRGLIGWIAQKADFNIS